MVEIFKGENEISFKNKFSTADACLSYLSAYRWKDGFECPHCKGKEESNCNIVHHKRCKKCNYIISPTAHTLFHKVKFGLEKAFLIIFKMSATTKSISAEQLAKNVGINRKTALLFQQKVRVAMKSSEKYPLEGSVEVDEAFIGEQETGVMGRGAVKKSQIVVAIERNGGKGIKRMYVKKIENASSAELKPFFEKHISVKANVLTDKWSGYFPLKKEFQIEQQKSKPKENFKVMHRGIQQLKSWIRGIHHSVNANYLQGYLNEFCYRINRSIFKESIFDNLLNRMMVAEPCAKNQIKFVYCS